jgi:hypothetical protein
MPPFDSYSIVHLSNHPYEAQIDCFQSGVRIGVIVFYNDTITLPPNVDSSPPTIHFPTSRLNEIANTLRNERNLVFNFTPANLIGSVGTSAVEWVGEVEA